MDLKEILNNIPRCGTCKHWDNHTFSDYQNEERQCIIAELKKSNNMMESVCEGEGILGQLVTTKDFGCILHSDLGIKH